MIRCCVAALLACCVLGSAPRASAQTMYDCQSIAKPTLRLACYDKLSPPVAANAKRKPAATATDFDREDARMRQLLKPICRNC